MKQTWKTHDVTNQFPEIADYNLFSTDPVLNDYLKKMGANWTISELEQIGDKLGKAEAMHQAHLANKYTPEHKPFDNRGNRIDTVEFHPGWHWFMQYLKNSGLITRPFEDNTSGRWAFAAANFILHAQVEDGSLCPATMTQASIPVLQKEPQLWDQLKDKLLSREYDLRDVPLAQKTSIWVGMGMTEKQGGSDVRTNATVATPVGASGQGEAYTLNGHKWFFSAPMCDAHLVVARTSNTDALACFFVPRWKPDGTKNPVVIQRLKDKVGNKSNSSSEVEFQDAYGILIGKEGRGIPTIIEMATYTRLSCVLGATGIIRQATVQGIAYTRQRKAFGNTLYNQPLMRSVLTDFALESEAATLTALHLANAFEKGDSDPLAKAWKRIVTPAAKYWICKRSVTLTAEAMEVFGGNGYVEDGVLGRLFREAPVNSIWEGSGNVMCLDVLRALHKEADLAHLLMDELQDMANGNPHLLTALGKLAELFQTDPAEIEAISRYLVERMILVVQACLLNKYAPEVVREAFIQTRIVHPVSANFGAIQTQEINTEAILERAFPSGAETGVATAYHDQITTQIN